MSIKKCLNDKVLAGKLTREQADEVLENVKKYEKAARASLGPDGASAEAMAKAAQEAVEKAARGEKRAVLKILARERNLEWAKSHPKGIGAGIASIFARDIHGLAGHENVDSVQKALRSMLHGMAADFVESYHPKIGLRPRDPAGQRAMVFELYGKASGDATATAAGKSYAGATDMSVRWARESGARIGKLEDWRLPQKPDATIVGRLGKDRYVDLMQDALAKGWLAIDDWKTGGAVSPERAKEIISNAFDRISTNGLSDMVPGERNFAPLVDRMIERRAFRWTTPEAWLWQNETFGRGDSFIFNTMTSHLDDMAHDIGLLRVLGPDPDGMARFLIDNVKKEGGSGKLVEALYDEVSGAAHIPVNARFAAIMRSTREFLSSAQLGSATLSVTGDFASLRQSAAWMGLPQMKLAQEYVSLLNPASRADKARAARGAVIAESFTSAVSAAARGQMEDFGTGWTASMADTVIRASGLTAHTDAAKMAFQRTAMANLADLSGREYKTLPKETLRFFESHGINEADWNLAKSFGVVDYGEGIKFLEPLAMVKSEDKAARSTGIKLQSALIQETNMAVPTPGAREKAMVTWGTRPGSVEGEFLRSLGQYKGFMASLTSGHLMRSVEELKSGRGGYAASLAVGLTAAGALTIQLKAISQGKDPREMFGDPATSAKFWGASFIQGGGGGIIGDFLYSSVTRAGTTPWTTLVGGPTGGLVDSLVSLGFVNLGQWGQEKDTNIGAETATFIRRNTPGSTLWYARLAMDRLIFDQLHKQLDPDYSQRFSRQTERALRDYGQRFWWKPGQTEPSRGPDLSTVVQ